MRQMVQTVSVGNLVVDNTISVSLLFDNCFHPFHFLKNPNCLDSKYLCYIFHNEEITILDYFWSKWWKEKKR